MTKACTNCEHATGAVAELLRIYESTDTPKVMGILTDIVANDKNLHPCERTALANLMQLVNSITDDKIRELTAELEELKKTA